MRLISTSCNGCMIWTHWMFANIFHLLLATCLCRYPQMQIFPFFPPKCREYHISAVEKLLFLRFHCQFTQRNQYLHAIHSLVVFISHWYQLPVYSSLSSSRRSVVRLTKHSLLLQFHIKSTLAITASSVNPECITAVGCMKPRRQNTDKDNEGCEAVLLTQQWELGS